MLLGNEQVQIDIRRSLKARVHILKGMKGLGKYEVALENAKRALCLFEDPRKCTCDSCRRFDEQCHPDIFRLSLEKGESSIKAESVLEMAKFSSTRPITSRVKVIVIDDANSMTAQAQNKLLKTLEDSPDYVKFFIVTHGHLLDTVESRGIVHRFFPLTDEKMRTFVKGLNLSKSEDELYLVASSGGCPGTAVMLANDKDFMEYSCSLEAKDEVEFLNRLGLVKEKNSKNIVALLQDNLFYYLTFLKHVFMSKVQMNASATTKNTKYLKKVLDTVQTLLGLALKKQITEEHLLFLSSCIYGGG